MSDLFIDTSVLLQETEAQYHARRGECETAHLLNEFRECPQLHHKRVAGLIPDKAGPEYLLGRAAHKRILEGRDAFERAFAVGGPINPRTGRPFGSETKAFAEWALSQGRPVLTPEQVLLIDSLAAGVAANSEAVDLLTYGVAEGVVRASYCGVLCQARLDWVHPHRGIVDLKTVKDLTYFECDVRKLGYVHQMAFYRSMLAQVLDGLLVPVHIIAVEKKEPFRCGVWRLSEDCLAIAQRENEAALRRLIRCRDLGDWPTGYEEVRVLDAA